MLYCGRTIGAKILVSRKPIDLKAICLMVGVCLIGAFSADRPEIHDGSSPRLWSRSPQVRHRGRLRLRARSAARADGGVFRENVVCSMGATSAIRPVPDGVHCLHQSGPGLSVTCRLELVKDRRIANRSITPNDAEIGIANNTPMKPNSQPKANSANIIQTGLRLTRRPMTRGDST
jgi:hypothetical protein